MIRDDARKGFSVFLRPAGVHSVVLASRNTRNRKCNVTVAKGATIASDLARTRAKEYRAMLRQGRDVLETTPRVRGMASVSGRIDAGPTSSVVAAWRAATQAVDAMRIEGPLRQSLEVYAWVTWPCNVSSGRFKRSAAANPPPGSARQAAAGFAAAAALRARASGCSGPAEVGLGAGRGGLGRCSVARNVGIGQDGRRWADTDP